MFTDEQVTRMLEADRFTYILCALIAKRVTTTTVMNGTSTGGAAALVADTRLLLAKAAA